MFIINSIGMNVASLEILRPAKLHFGPSVGTMGTLNEVSLRIPWEYMDVA